MDLGYNKEIELSEVPFPPGLFFTKNENCLELESLFGKNIIVTSSGIEIISEKESFIIERDNISNLSIETYFLSDSPYLCTSCYKIIVNLKREVEIPKTFSKNHQRLELFIDERINSKLVVFFLMQEFSKVLNLPLINSSQNEDPLDAPNLYNFDVIKNDNQNLIIKKNSLFNLWQFLKIIMSSLVLPFCCIFFIIMIVNETKEEAISITTILLFSYINSVILSISFFDIYFYYTRQGRYISIDSLQVLISKLRLIKSKPSKPKTIEIDRNMTIGINKVQYPFKRMNEGNHNFEVVLYKDYDFNSKTSNKVLIDKITQPEAEYIAQKICYLANNNNEKKLNYRNDIQTIKRISIYKIVSLILVILLLNLGVCYATFAITKTQLYTIKNPEILDHHVLKNLGYINVGLGRWQKNQKYIEVINIPASYEYNGQQYYIKKIGDGCFKYSNELEKISIPTGVTSIGKEAFYCCLCLKLKIPDSVTEIGENAFKGVKHIEYHGNAKGAPWGANSMN